MRMKWKYPMYFSSLVVAIAFTAVSCSDSSTAPQPTANASNGPQVTYQKLPDLQASFNWPGRYHTEALAQIYGKLSRGQQGTSKADKCRVAVGALKEFDRSFSKDGKAKGIADDFLTADFCSGDPSQQFAVTNALIEKNSGFSPQALSSFHHILDVLDSKTSAAAMVSSVKGIEGAASRTLSANEAAAVVSLGSVAISSVQYWDANSVKWEALSPGGVSNQLYTGIRPSGTLLFTPAGAPRRSISADPIMKADASAFLSSMLVGWFLGAADLEVSIIRATVASTIAALHF